MNPDFLKIDNTSFFSEIYTRMNKNEREEKSEREEEEEMSLVKKT